MQRDQLRVDLDSQALQSDTFIRAFSPRRFTPDQAGGCFRLQISNAIDAREAREQPRGEPAMADKAGLPAEWPQHTPMRSTSPAHAPGVGRVDLEEGSSRLQLSLDAPAFVPPLTKLLLVSQATWSVRGIPSFCNIMGRIRRVRLR